MKSIVQNTTGLSLQYKNTYQLHNMCPHSSETNMNRHTSLFIRTVANLSVQMIFSKQYMKFSSVSSLLEYFVHDINGYFQSYSLNC